MSATSTLNLKLWSNYSPSETNKTSETGEPNKLMNVGTAWPIEPSGIIPEPDDTFPAPVVDGTIKVYRGLHPETLVIQWLFPNVHVGHVLWISQAPARLTFAQVDTVRHIERQLADDWADTIRCIPFTTPPQLQSHWDLEKYTRSEKLPVSKRGRDQQLVLKQLSAETINHYANLLENRKYEFTDLNIDLAIHRDEGLAYYTGNNGLRTYPLDRLGYHNICRALGRVRAYRRKNNPRQYIC